jgi:hypothetical protein
MIISANIGNFDTISDPPFGLRYQCYTEQNLPFQLPNLDNRLKGKYVKIQTHRFRDDPYWIWVDGSVQIVSERFTRFMRTKLEGHDIAIPLHPDRANVFEEISYILEHIKAGKDYVKSRYENEPLAEEREFYIQQGLPTQFPLYACRVFARVNSAKVNAAFNDWWMGCLEYSNFDQTYFSYIAWKHRLKIASFPYEDILRYVRINRHNNDNRPPL